MGPSQQRGDKGRGAVQSPSSPFYPVPASKGPKQHPPVATGSPNPEAENKNEKLSEKEEVEFGVHDLHLTIATWPTLSPTPSPFAASKNGKQWPQK